MGSFKEQSPAAVVDTSITPPLLSPASLSGPAKFPFYGAHVNHCAALHAFIQLELPDIMLKHYADKPVRAVEIGREHGMDIDLLFRLLRMMADNNIVAIHKDIDVSGLQHYPYTYKPEYNTGFTLTEDGKLLTKDHPTHVADEIKWEMSSLLQPLPQYSAHLIKHGYRDGTALNLSLGLKPDVAAIWSILRMPKYQSLKECFDNAMTGFTHATSDAIVNAVNFGKHKAICDIGTGLGTFFSKVLAHHTRIEKGILFDLPDVIELAKKVDEMSRSGVHRGRYEYHAGDFLKPESIPACEAYMEKWILHDWQDDKVVQILQNIHRAAVRNPTTSMASVKPVTLYVVEMVLLDDSDVATNFMKHSTDYYMMHIVGAKERTVKEYEFLLNQGGWALKHVHTVPHSPFAVIEATSE